MASFDGEQTRIQQYRYDVLYRLFEESTRDQGNTVLQSATYTYDRVGNRVYAIEDGVHTQYCYDANERLLGAGGVSYAYDNAGNLLSETQDGQTKTYTWDAKHKLARASTPQARVDYLYDVDGIRRAKLVNGQRTDYVVDHNTAYARAGGQGAGLAHGGRRGRWTTAIIPDQPGKLKASRLPNVGFLHTLIVGFLQGLPNDQEDLG